MNKQALKLAILWQYCAFKFWLRENFQDLLSCLKGFLYFLLIFLRLFLAPLCFLLCLVYVWPTYKQIANADQKSLEKIKKHIRGGLQ